MNFVLDSVKFVKTADRNFRKFKARNLGPFEKLKIPACIMYSTKPLTYLLRKQNDSSAFIHGYCSNVSFRCLLTLRFLHASFVILEIHVRTTIIERFGDALSLNYFFFSDKQLCVDFLVFGSIKSRFVNVFTITTFE